MEPDFGAFMGTRSEKTKEARIKSEKNRLNRIFKEGDPARRDMLKRLIENAAFMSVSLEELQEIINEKGYTEEYQNGANQSGVKKCSEVEIYNTMIKNFTATVKLMAELLPESAPEADKLIAFVTRK